MNTAKRMLSLLNRLQEMKLLTPPGEQLDPVSYTHLTLPTN